MHRLARALFSIVLTVAALATTGARQDPQAPVFRSGTEMVEVYAIVQDGDGRFVSGLTADDFVLRTEPGRAG